jgi:hypothetical protein
MYSQYEEEKHILDAVGGLGSLTEHGSTLAELPDGITRPRFLEIGAWHPTDKSNTRALVELGWSGVMIEPSPGPLLNLLSEYSGNDRITLVSACVGLEPGIVELMVTDDAVSSTDRHQYDAWKDVTKFRGALHVPVLTWEMITNRWGGFQMISLDAEGLSADLFLAMLAAGLQPTCVVVEHDSRLEELCSAATPLHYNVTYANGTNAVFIRK